MAPPGSREEPDLGEAFDRLVSEGRQRLSRPLLPLLSTGLLGGVDVSIGVLIYLVVETETDQPLLASLAFTIGSSRCCWRGLSSTGWARWVGRCSAI